MNQHLVSIFSIVKEEKVFQFMSGQATFDEVMDVLEQFKQEFTEMKKRAEELEAEKKKEQESVEPVVVNADSIN